jgi:hypothetical protein
MRLPQVKDALIALSGEPHCPSDIAKRLRKLALEIPRRKPYSRGPAKSAPITAALRQKIRDFYFSNPGLTQLEVGRKFNVNPGRVSEAIRGFRK